MFEIREATASDIGKIASIHIAAFPGFFLSRLGPRFLREVYSSLIDDETGSLIVADREGEILGFAAGTLDPEDFYKRLRKRKWPVLLLKALPGIVKSPAFVIRKLWSAIGYSGDTPDNQPGGALLGSLGVSPNTQRQGAGDALVESFCKFAEARGKRYVYVITDKDTNTGVTSFYKKIGFTIDTIITKQNNRRMYRLIKPLNNNLSNP